MLVTYSDKVSDLDVILKEFVVLVVIVYRLEVFGDVLKCVTRVRKFGIHRQVAWCIESNIVEDCRLGDLLTRGA